MLKTKAQIKLISSLCQTKKYQPPPHDPHPLLPADSGGRVWECDLWGSCPPKTSSFKKNKSTLFGQMPLERKWGWKEKE